MKCFSLILIAKGVEPHIRRTERVRERKKERGRHFDGRVLESG